MQKANDCGGDELSLSKVFSSMRQNAQTEFEKGKLFENFAGYTCLTMTFSNNIFQTSGFMMMGQLK